MPVLLAVFLLLGALPMSAYAAEVSYSDTRWNRGWYYSTPDDMAGRRLYVYGIVDSISELTEDSTDKGILLEAEGPTGRLDAAFWLYRLCGDMPEGLCPFTDVPEDYSEAVTWLYEAGVTKGVGGGRYGTGDITRYQLLVMLSRLLQWNTEDKDEVLTIACEQGLLRAKEETEIFSRGEMFQILCALLDRQFPERRIAMRPEMSPPHEIALTVTSYEDAVEQISEALNLLPSNIVVQFTEDCPQEELDQFLSCFDWVSDSVARVIITSVDHSILAPYFMSQYKDQRYKLWISNYAPAYEVSADALDWIRVYEDESYSAAIRQFETEYLAPLKELDSNYARAKSAHDLLCRLASYDYTEYYQHTQFEAHRLLGFVQRRQIVCDGYAYTYQWMLRYLGIDSYVVIGTAAGEGHAWNKVFLDGAWYNVDVCWDDTGYGDFFFLKSDASLEANRHQFTDQYSTTDYSSPDNYRR